MDDAPLRAILHVDMDAFFASVEQLANPEISGRPVLVGGSAERRGVVAACSYEARRFGVRSAMPMRQALELCPGAIVVPARLPLYAEVSARIMDIFRGYTRLVQSISLDEAYLDISAAVHDFADAVLLAQNLKTRVREETGLSCSVGLAPNRFLAKIASDIDKPDGFFPVRPEEVERFLLPLSVRRLPGVGPRTAARMAELGLRRVADLRACSRETLCEHFGEAAGARFYDLARGFDPSPVNPERVVKSVSREQTFTPDLADPEKQDEALELLAHRVWDRLVKEQLSPRTVGVKIRLADFSTLSRSLSPADPLDSAESLAHFALGLFHGALPRPRPVRLLGVKAENFAPDAARQRLLWEATPREAP
ncbi:DNA polymerase IV [bacterium]|nr:DNA polymerase IV [bacterium]